MSANKTAIEPASDELLKALDLIIVVDRSGSMETDSNRLKGKSRYQEVEEMAEQAASVMSRYDDDGITAIFFNNGVKVKDGVQAETVKEMFAELQPGGGTALDLALEEVHKKAKSSSKEVVALVFTDGAPNDENAVVNVINRMGALGRPKIGLAFVQVGNDAHAGKFLDKLDNDLKVDVVATFTEEQAEELSIKQLITAARTE